MDMILFLAVIACLAIVVAWYVANETAGAQGEKGLLAIAVETAAPPPETYGEKPRGVAETVAPQADERAPAFRPARAGARYGAAQKARYRPQARAASRANNPKAN
jgi:hypothetical protein